MRCRGNAGTIQVFVLSGFIRIYQSQKVLSWNAGEIITHFSQYRENSFEMAQFRAALNPVEIFATRN